MWRDEVGANVLHGLPSSSRLVLVRIRTAPRRRGRFAGPSLVDALVGVGTAASQKNLLAGLAAVYDRLEIRTTLTPPAVIDLYAAAHDQSPPSPVTQFLKPTIILHGHAGTEVLAPYGEAEGSWVGPIGFFGLLLGIGFVLGRASK